MYICDLLLLNYMVFGWGKKKQLVEEAREQPVISTPKEITLENIPGIIVDITNLRQKTLIAEIKSFQKKIDSDRKVISSIASELEKDSLNTDDMDPHLVILVNRGKKEVISAIQNELQTKFSNIDTFANVLDFQRSSSRGIKKVGDMLGNHSRVIHIFAKKYAKKLKNDMGILKNNLDEVNSLISNYNSNQELLDEIKKSLDDISNAKNDIEKIERRKTELEKLLDAEQQSQVNLKAEIDKVKSSSEYEEFQITQEKIISLLNDEKATKHGIEEQFIKISRPLNKYGYVSSLDKPLKIMVGELAKSPYNILSESNESDIKTILNSVRSNVESGSVSVKDIQKSKHAINEIYESLPEFIKQKASFTEKKSELDHKSSLFDNHSLNKLLDDLKKSQFNISDTESKISEIAKQIDSSKNSIYDIISKLELNLRQASSVAYKLSYNENDFQN